jgi:hypothetical protein
MADAVLVIDGKPTFEIKSSHDPYVDQSTAREILWARQNDRPMISLLSASGWGNIAEMIDSRYAEDMFVGHEWLYNHARQVLRTNTGVDVIKQQINQSELSILQAGLSVIACHGLIDKATSDYATRILEIAGLDPVTDMPALMPEFDPTCILGGEPKTPASEVIIDHIESDSNLVKFAHAELAMIEARIDPSDAIGLEMQQMMTKHILHMVAEFSKEGHSGTSGSYAIGALTRLLNFEPLSPLTGEADEWNEVSDGVFQNRRCAHIFKDGLDGQAYDSQGKVFREPSGACFTGRESRVNITFPYVVPDRPNFVDVLEERGPNGEIREVAPTTFTIPQGPLINAVTALDEAHESLNHKGNRRYARALIGRVLPILREMTGGQG